MAIPTTEAELTGYQGRNDWFQTWSGKTLFLLDPDPEKICIEDIAHALARQCRYNGHVDCMHYSVAQHSVLVSWVVPSQFAPVGLLHDAAEAYLGDCVRPLKNQLPEYAKLEHLWSMAIGKAFGLGNKLVQKCPTVKHADLVLLATELRDLWKPGSRSPFWNHKAESNMKPMKKIIWSWVDPAVAEMFFLQRFHKLWGLKDA